MQKSRVKEGRTIYLIYCCLLCSHLNVRIINRIICFKRSGINRSGIRICGCGICGITGGGISGISGIAGVESIVDVLAEKDIDKRTKMRLAIEELDGMLKTDDNKMDKGIRVCLQASLQYLQLRYQDQTRIGASTTIASSLGWGDYKARCIGVWAQNWIKWRKLPKENHGWGPEGYMLEIEFGRGIHVSEFLCELLGRVYLTEEQHAAHPKIPNHYVTELLEIGANYE
ncbi:38770_t:CDS:2, partial [Gigaspora margarita]